MCYLVGYSFTLAGFSLFSASMIFQSDSLVDHHVVYLYLAYSYTTC